MSIITSITTTTTARIVIAVAMSITTDTTITTMQTMYLPAAALKQARSSMLTHFVKLWNRFATREATVRFFAQRESFLVSAVRGCTSTTFPVKRTCVAARLPLSDAYALSVLI
jgi:hypothetical protein